MDFMTSVKTVLTEKFADFSGRASRSEYWWFALFNFIISIITSVVGGILGTPIISGLVALALLIPGIAVGVRRLHDIDKSGWWLLIAFVPIIGILVLLYFLVIKGTTGSNRFGEDQLK